MIKDILTLRYYRDQEISFPKLSVMDFEKRKVTQPVDFIEKSIGKIIHDELSSPKIKNIAVALSGGIDSTLTLALLRKNLPDVRIDTIFVKFLDSIDELSRTNRIAEKFETDNHELFIENYLKELPKAISIIKIPLWEIHWYYLAKKSKEFSDFLVTGDGGDELFGGYVFRYEKFLKMLKPGIGPLEKVKLYLECHERDWVPDQEKLFAEKMQFSWKKIYSFLLPYFENNLHPLNQVFLADFNGKLVNNWVPVNNKIKNHFGVKNVMPYLSNELISYVPHLSHELKYDKKRNLGKILLRKLLSKHNSEKLVMTRKVGFGVNTLAVWNHIGRELCDNYLLDGRIVKEGLVNKDWINLHFSELKNNLDVRYVNKFLGLLALEIWYRLFVSKEMSPKTLLT